MRALILSFVASLVGSAVAEASPNQLPYVKIGVNKPLRIHQAPTGADGPTIPRPPRRPENLTVSRTLFVNNCMPNGCTVSPGNDIGGSKTNRSSIPNQTSSLSAWRWGDTLWQELMTCVRATFAPFNINIVETDPGQTDHFEVIVAGTAEQVQYSDAGGVAPFVSCDTSENNVISYVFASQTNDINYLCAAVAQEAAHVWGLDHELDADDPMTYLDLGSEKRFQNSSPRCGEELNQPRNCRCRGNNVIGSNQNSFEFMRSTFGLNPNLGPASVSINRPLPGQWVRPRFAIYAELNDELSIMQGSLTIDGTVTEEFTGSTILAWAAPADLPSGSRKVELTIRDAADRTVTADVTVNVVATCKNGGGCPGGTTCIDELCVPGADQAGGLGAPCTDNADCVTDKCSSDGTASLCTGSCGAGGSCPDGFACITSANTCWPEYSEGGCSSSGSAAPVFLLIVLGGLFLGRRRR